MIGRVLGNRYEIVEKIGSGGMSHVYKAKCGLLNRYVAVKVLRPEFTSDEEFVRKFRRESQAAASLSHQNIVSIYDVGVDGDIYYIVMEYIEGKTLKELIRERKRLGAVQAAEIAQQICKALLHAHKNHIIHRDIKPHNILITKDGVAKVTDFGIARAVTGSTVTNTGSVIGSVHYFSPEQARGGYIDEKSDLYSLGIVMYEMVTGRVPFEGESPISIALKHLQEQVTPPSKILDDFPKGLEQIIMKAIEKEAAKRYNTAQEMLLDLKSFCLDKDVVFGLYGGDKGESPTIVMSAVREETAGDGEKKKKSSDFPGKGKKARKAPVALLAVVLLALVAVGFGASYLLNELLSVKVVKVPNIVGKTEEEARNTLKELGLDMEIRERQNNANFEAGTVISQYPAEGTDNKVTNPVLVVLSLGPERTEVPYLINFNSAEAELKLQLAGLDVGEVTPRYSETVTVGVVMDQNPQPGIMVDQGTAVDLVVSAGPELQPVSVPSVVGLDLETAKARLQDAGMIIADTFYQESDLPKGQVVSQSVEPNTVVEKGASIVLGVSSGKTEVEPEVEGTRILTVTLPQGEKNVKVTVKKYQDGVEEIEYQRRHDADEGPLKIEVKGKGKVRVVVLFNDVPYRDQIIDFSKEE